MALAMALAAGAVVWRTLATIRSLDDAALQSQARLVASHLSIGPDGTPRLDLSQGLALTVDWYKALQRGQDLRRVSLDQLERVLHGAVANGATQ